MVSPDRNGQINWSWLTYRISDHMVIDVWRYGLTALSFYALAAGIYYFTKVHIHNRLHVMSVIVNSLVAIYVILQEVEQYGKSMLVWRLPFQTVIMMAVWYSVIVSRRARYQGVEL